MNQITLQTPLKDVLAALLESYCETEQNSMSLTLQAGLAVGRFELTLVGAEGIGEDD